MDEIKDAIQAARAQRITHMVSQFLKSENSDTEGSIQKGMATPEDDGVDYDAETEHVDADNNIEGIEKARSGVYADTAENRRLNRVGQQYGGKKKQETVKQQGKDKNSNRTYDVPHIMWAMGESSKMSAAVESLANVDFSEMDEKEIKSVVEKLPAKKLDELYNRYIHKSENERIFEKGIMGGELTPEEGAEMTELTKSDIMYAFSDGSDAIKLTKTGAEIKQQIQDVVRPELVTHLGSLKAQADEKLKDCGAAPTELPDPYMTGGVAMDCGYKRYPWDAVYYDENARKDSITAEDDENKNGLRPESKEQATARREYNDLVYQMYNVCADLKALELLSQVKDKKNYDLTPRQAACLKF